VVTRGQEVAAAAGAVGWLRGVNDRGTSGRYPPSEKGSLAESRRWEGFAECKSSAPTESSDTQSPRFQHHVWVGLSDSKRCGSLGTILGSFATVIIALFTKDPGDHPERAKYSAPMGLSILLWSCT
jgi:hypothetical protein